MNLNHLDLPVLDVTATQHFFVNHFGFSCYYQRDDLVVLKDEAGFALTLSQLSAARAADFPIGFHLGFILEHEDTVRQTYARLVASDVEIICPLGQLGGALTFQCCGHHRAKTGKLYAKAESIAAQAFQLESLMSSSSKSYQQSI